MAKLSLKSNILTQTDEDAALQAKQKQSNLKGIIALVLAIVAILSSITVTTIIGNIEEYKKVAQANAWAVALEVGSVLAIVDPVEEPFNISWDPATKMLTMPIKGEDKAIKRYLPLTDGTELIFTNNEDNLVKETFMYCVAVEYKGMKAYHNAKEAVSSCNGVIE